LVDAARVDGASLIDIFWRIYMPLGRPALAALAIADSGYDVHLVERTDMLGGKVERPEKKEYGIAYLEHNDTGGLFAGVDERTLDGVDRRLRRRADAQGKTRGA
jgi:hypothetical protein